MHVRFGAIPTAAWKNEAVKDTIDQFMWGFQQHFRRGVERGIEQALSEIKLPVKVRAILVGFALDDEAQHQLCVEPEDGPLSVDNLLLVADRTAELFEADPESRTIHTNRRYHQSRRAGTLRRSRANAVVEAIGASGKFEGLTFFASSSASIDGYEVHTCVGVPTAAFDSVPALDDEDVGVVYVGRSLQHEVIAECLGRADRALYFPDPGAGLRVLGATDAIVKAAAERLIDGMVYRTGGLPTDLFNKVNAFTSLSYERAGAGGRLVIADGERIADWARIQFQKPLSLHDARIMRKLLELSDASTAVLADYESAYGLGACDSSPKIVEILVRGHADWEVSFGGLALVRVSYGHPTLPRPPLDRDQFDSTAARTVGSADLDRIWDVVEAAHASGHGTTLVVSHDPAGEASRLGGQAVPIDPSFLGPADILRLGRVDGAVILGPDGLCHAFGVILDGDAVPGRGDPARGSRFNSAVRYQRTRAPNSLVIVVSDDRAVDLIPQLMSQIDKQEVESAVSSFCSSCNADPVDGEESGRTYDLVEDLAFYLNEDQCQRVNASYEGEMRRRLEAGGIAVSRASLRPHPDMDDSYFY